MAKRTRISTLNYDASAYQNIVDNFLNITYGRMTAATRHGVSLTVNDLRDMTKSNLAGTGLKTNSPIPPGSRFGSKWQGGATLMDAVKAYLVHNTTKGFVHILGNKDADGTFITRFYERGTKDRYRANGGWTGVLPAYNFFSSAISQANDIFIRNMNQSYDSAIKELNSRT